MILVTTPKSAQSHHCTLKRLAILFKRQRTQLPICRHQLQPNYGCRKITVPVARTVRSGRARACNRNVRQRGHIVYCHTFHVHTLAQLAVSDSRAARNCPSLGIKFYRHVQLLQ